MASERSTEHRSESLHRRRWQPVIRRRMPHICFAVVASVVLVYCCTASAQASQHSTTPALTSHRGHSFKTSGCEGLRVLCRIASVVNSWCADDRQRMTHGLSIQVVVCKNCKQQAQLHFLQSLLTMPSEHVLPLVC